MAKRRPKREPPSPSWSVPISVAGIPETGRRLDIAADAATCTALAGVIGIAALPRLEISAELFRVGRVGVRVAGQVSATVEQACVVTLDPLRSEVVEHFDLTFAPPAGEAAAAVELTLEEGSDEPPETLRDGTVDLGAVAVEFLLLGIDPYPRKPGVAFDAPVAGDPAGGPFAALAALKKPT